MRILEKGTVPASSVEPISLSYNLMNRSSRLVSPAKNIT